MKDESDKEFYKLRLSTASIVNGILPKIHKALRQMP